MTFDVELPGKEELEQVLTIAVGAAAALVLLKITGAVVDAAKEHSQNKQIRKLKKQVSELEDRIESLEKARA